MSVTYFTKRQPTGYKVGGIRLRHRLSSGTSGGDSRQQIEGGAGCLQRGIAELRRSDQLTTSGLNPLPGWWSAKRPLSSKSKTNLKSLFSTLAASPRAPARLSSLRCCSSSSVPHPRRGITNSTPKVCARRWHRSSSSPPPPRASTATLQEGATGVDTGDAGKLAADEAGVDVGGVGGLAEDETLSPLRPVRVVERLARAPATAPSGPSFRVWSCRCAAGAALAQDLKLVVLIPQ